jgi:hypothetical protein
MESIRTLVTVLGAIAALGGLASVGYVQAIHRGTRGRALAIGAAVAVVGAGAFLAGALVGGDSSDALPGLATRARSTATPRPEPSPTATLEPVEAFRSSIRDIGSRADEAGTTLFQLLRTSSSDSPIWEAQVRQTVGEFARLRARAGALSPPEGWEDIQGDLLAVLDSLVQAGQGIRESFDAFQAGNEAIAAELIDGAVEDLAAAVPLLQTVGERLESRADAEEAAKGGEDATETVVPE